MKTVKLQKEHKDKIIKICEKLFPIINLKQKNTIKRGEIIDTKWILEQDVMEYYFSWEEYGKPRQLDGPDIIHVIKKLEESKIDGQVLVGNYKHQYYHWYEFMLEIIIPTFYKKEIKKYGKGYLKNKQMLFLDITFNFIDMIYIQLFN